MRPAVRAAVNRCSSYREVSFALLPGNGSLCVFCAGACCGNCRFPLARRVECTACTHGFLHFRCLADLPTAVANVAGQQRLCAACAAAIVVTSATDSARTPRGDALKQAAKRVKRVRPATAGCGPPRRGKTPPTTPAGFSRAGTPAALETLAQDWHPSTGASSRGASNDPGERNTFLVGASLEEA